MKSNLIKSATFIKKAVRHNVYAGMLFMFLLSIRQSNAQVSPVIQLKIDSIFRHWNTDSTPGMELLVLSKGKVILNRPYGLSNLLAKSPNSSEHKMWVASVSKQITAIALALLVNEKKLDLEDDIRKYLPELPFLGDTIKIKHLVYHTSGLRDGFTLTAMSFKGEDEYTNENILKYLSKQKGRNFRAGERFEYNNGGYVLLAIIVERVSKLNFPDFVKRFIFDPLDMHESRFYSEFPKNDPTIAIGYAVSTDNNHRTYVPTNFKGKTYGSTGLVTTASDLAKWDRIFYEPLFGKRVKQMQLQPGTLNNGKKIPYAFGLEIELYKDKNAITHSGVDAGYKAEVLRFPGEDFSVICLANTEDAYSLTNKLFTIAELFLHFHKPLSQDNRSTCKPQAGAYLNVESLAAMKFVNLGNEVSIANAADGYYQPLTPSGNCSYTIKGILLDRYHLRKNILKFETRAELALYHSINTTKPTVTDLRSAAGAWYSPELEATYHFFEKDGTLFLKFFDAYDIPLTPYEGNLYVGDFLGTNIIEFTKDNNGKIVSMKFNRDGIRNLSFEKR